MFDNYPTVQLAVLQGRGKNLKLSSAEPPAVLFGARSKAPYPDGLILELPADAYAAAAAAPLPSARPPRSSRHVLRALC